jgi:hypothetical protein
VGTTCSVIAASVNVASVAPMTTYCFRNAA